MATIVPRLPLPKAKFGIDTTLDPGVAPPTPLDTSPASAATYPPAPLLVMPLSPPLNPPAKRPGVTVAAVFWILAKAAAWSL